MAPHVHREAELGIGFATIYEAVLIGHIKMMDI